VLHKRIYIEIETNHVIPRKLGKINLRRCKKYASSLPHVCSLSQSFLHFTSITVPAGNGVIQVEWNVVAYSLENTAGKKLYKRGLNKIVILKKSTEISRAVISSDLLSPLFFPQVFQSSPPFFINLIYEMLQHGINQHCFVTRYRFEN